MLVLINLDSAAERRQRMLAQLARLGLTCERLGFDGRLLPKPAIAQRAKELFPALRFSAAGLSGPEIGCWLSHLLAWQRLLARPALAAATVIEDDVVLAPSFAAATETLRRGSPFDVVFLGTSSRNLSARRRTVVDGLCLHQPVGPIFNTWGYVIRREWAARFFAAPSVAISAPIDHLLGGRVGGALRPRIAVLRPAVVDEEPALAAASQIEPYTWRLDRSRLVEAARRRLLRSRVGDLYFSLYRYL